MAKREKVRRISLNIAKQYSLTSLKGRRYKALRDEYDIKELNAMMERVIWLVLGPLASALEGADRETICNQIRNANVAMATIQHETLDLVGGVTDDSLIMNGTPPTTVDGSLPADIPEKDADDLPVEDDSSVQNGLDAIFGA